MAWLFLAGVAVVIVAVVVVGVARSRSETLKRRFGPEYERLVAKSGDRRNVEAHLRGLVKRHAALDVHELEPAAQAGLGLRWQEIQLAFVDEPAACVAAADALIVEVLRSRGYPAGGLEARLALLSVDHPRIVEAYRSAAAIHQRAGDRPAPIDDLRTAFRKYRTVFEGVAGREVRRPLRLVHPTQGRAREDQQGAGRDAAQA